MDCSACGSSLTLEVGTDRPLSTSPTEAILAADVNECIEMIQDCWNCGWHEERQLRVASIERTAGDETAVERAALVGEITDELAAIDDLATLEEALSEIRRHRRLESSTTERDETTSGG
ncbi:hypothetical protein [Haloarchaeobius salinus]|uniref:hypothetical protein n=1 Tax=Haloarchaeobius salinus TaxID=1198298 RepID=UPI00210B8ADE|nr:hypothetical protein [Haloarchaeobius salinus]